MTIRRISTAALAALAAALLSLGATAPAHAAAGDKKVEVIKEA
ncbi:hypothetical protein ACFRI7_33315 [Streptomyces sp. NPDC056716]